MMFGGKIPRPGRHIFTSFRSCQAAVGTCLLSLALTAGGITQQARMPRDSVRHQRIMESEVPGRRTELKTLKGARLFVGEDFERGSRVPLIVHFHGAPWLVEKHIAGSLPRATLITVQLGAGSSAYRRPFVDADLFSKLIDEARNAIGLKGDWSSITLIGFSAGYGAIRAILRQEKYYRRVDAVILLDGVHASYSPEGKPTADGGIVNAADLDSFRKLARDAAAGNKSFLITHSEIFPGTYASTTECADYLLSSLAVKRTAGEKPGPMGMLQRSKAARGRFTVIGYSGKTAADHIDHLHAMPAWFKYIRIK